MTNCERSYHQNLKVLTPQQYWLLQHQISAFWHEFGINDGLFIKKEDLQEGRYRKGGKWLRVRPDRMRQELKEYIGWLESYRAKWNAPSSPSDVERYKNGFASFLEAESHSSERLDILRMISLLQNNEAEAREGT